MKKTILLFTCYFLLFTIALYGQVPPNAFNYSAVARGPAGQPIAMKTIGIQISIIKTSPTGVAQYIENHFPNTDAFGIFNLVIGTGAVQNGNMSAVNWSNDNYYLKIGMDANGGTNFLTMGTTQLLSVPFAMYAKSAGTAINTNDNDTSATNEFQTLSMSNDTLFLTNGGFVKIPATSGTVGSAHYIGEQFGGGVIFQLWKDTAGIEQGLIVDTSNIGISEIWSNIQTTIGPLAQSTWNGLANSSAIVAQLGHTTSAASLCLNSVNGGKNDWYLPSIDELMLLFSNRFYVNKSLSMIPGATLLETQYGYWSSTELSNDFALGVELTHGAAIPVSYNKSGWFSRVRPIRAF